MNLAVLWIKFLYFEDKIFAVDQKTSKSVKSFPLKIFWLYGTYNTCTI